MRPALLLTFALVCFSLFASSVFCHKSEAGIELKGACRNSSHCDNGFYCHFDNGTCTENGICAPVPQFCPMIYSPVCGCDNQTYSNWCAAAQNGASVQYMGECEGDKSCKSDSQCATGTEYCAFATGQCSGSGTCVEKPQICYMIYRPVCGCDGKTYSNDCVAASNGVNVKSAGAC